MQPQRELCRNGKFCENLKRPPFCQYEHNCRLQNCPYYMSEEGCLYIHKRSPPKKNLLEQYITINLDLINMEWLEDVLWNVSMRDIQQFLQIFARVINSDKPALKSNIVKIIVRTKIFGGHRLKQFREGILNQSRFTKARLKFLLQNLHFWNYGLKKIFEFEGQQCTALCVGNLASLVDQVEDVIIKLRGSLREEDFDSLYQDYKKVKSEVEELLRKWRGRNYPSDPLKFGPYEESKSRTARYVLKRTLNFREMSVNPTIDDLKTTKRPDLKELNLQGSFDNLNDYLDRNFKLLREDFISRLREGLHHQLRNSQERTRVTYIYPTVQIYYFYAVQGLEVIRLRFHFRRFNRHYSWKRAKKLMYGSLILLSCDNFKTIYLAVIRDRDGGEMDATYKAQQYVDISVEFVKEEKINPIQFYERYSCQNFVVIESKAYYEAYYHNLKILQEINHLPFSRIIVNVNFDGNTRPTYITQNDVKQVKLYIEKNGTFDASQKQAIMSCFERSFTLIQGPPGTGKTYIGAHVVNMLLKTYIRNEEEKKVQFHKAKKPIYVVCYTNHALDQFIEKFRPFTSSIIRIGGQSRRFNEYELDKTRLQMNLKRPADYHKIKSEFNSFLEDYKRNSLIMFRNIQLRMIDPHFYDAFPILKIITQEYQRQLAVELLMIRQWGEKFYKIFKKEAEETHRYYRFPEIFHWLGLLRFDEMKINCFSKEIRKSVMGENSENEELKEMIQDDDDAIEDQIERYQQRIHHHNFFKEYDRIDELLWYNKGSLYEQKTLRQVIQENWSASEELMRQKRIRNPLALLNHCNNPYDLQMEERWFINLQLVKQENKELKESLHNLVANMKERKVYLEKIDMDLRKRALQLVRVVAMTTTGAAKHKSLLKQVNAEIMIVEEAAQVLESHLITSITPSMKHIILIGDHQQLRPPMNVQELGLEYNFDISMFERLINNNFDYCMLKHQRRMRPYIADLTRLIYPQLKDAEEVKAYRSVEYLDEKNLIFFDHKFPEQHNESLESKQNLNEAMMVLKFAHFLVYESGYSGSHITILTLYSAQLLYLRHQRNHRYWGDQQMKKINIQTVDNYQGQENEIVLLSLVRSNEKDQIGFLQITNRVCVAFSRAKIGFYIFGNAECFINSFQKINHKKSNYQFNVKDIWKRIFTELEQKNAINDTLIFKCQCHGTIVIIKTPQDFKLASRFCQKTCNHKMDCNHKCKEKCHVIKPTPQIPNSHSLCPRICERKHPCGHPCQYKCFECWKDLKPCKTVVQKTLDCGHKVNVQCHEFNNQTDCDKKCSRILPCGHQCKKMCQEDCMTLTQAEKNSGFFYPCKVKINLQLPCNHALPVECGKKRDMGQLMKLCLQICRFPYGCGHICLELCCKCRDKQYHPLECKRQCDLSRFCRHQCQGICQTCPPCEEQCLFKCPHFQCQKLCHEQCERCKKPCINKCKHSQCSRLCFQLCDREPCNQPCQETLKCGHKCLGFCGEPCPDLCRSCNPSAINYGSITEQTKKKVARFVTLPECGHSFVAQDLDNYMNSTFQKGGSIFTCLSCHILINICPRYSNIFKLIRIKIRTLENAIHEEKKTFLNKYLTKGLQARFRNFPNFYPLEFKKTYQRIEKRLNPKLVYQSMNKLVSLVQSINIFAYLNTLSLQNPTIFNEHTEHTFDRIIYALNYEINDSKMFQLQICGCNLIAAYKEAISRKRNSKLAKTMIKEIQIYLRGQSTDPQQYDKLVEYFKELVGQKSYQNSLIEPFKYPRKSWYQCRNGHIFSYAKINIGIKKECPQCKKEALLIYEIV